MLQRLTEKMLRKVDLTFSEAQTALNTILEGNCNEIETAGFLTALVAKGEIAEEVAGMARAMRDHAVPVRPKSKPLVDTCGTGGDGQGTFNISTAAAIVAAGAGVKIAKHGNRAITSKCGSADVLAEMGVKIDADAEIIEQCIDQANIGFMFAPNHHPAMKYVQPVRKTLGFRTVFNILGPLSSPANVSIQIIGVARPLLMPLMAEALRLLGVNRAMVVYGEGLDEFTICGPTDTVELRGGEISNHTVDFSDYGIERAQVSDLAGGTLTDNVAIIQNILDNKLTGPCRDVVVFNAAAAIMMGSVAPGFVDAIKLAKESIDSGSAKNTLEKLIEISNS
ncbi:MAG: anthranilate phosphoribosyltransferase [Planctomycetes bacterium]|nr:anthranilate phosphoribosyltransferase [Planctomycetota bacterium]